MNPIDPNDETRISEAPIDRIHKAISLTRAGRHEESRQIYDEYHDSSRFGLDIDLSIMLMVLDGLRIFYEQHDTQAATKRMERARAIAQASIGCKVIDVVSVWLAHCQFNIGQYSEMKKSIDLALGRDVLSNDRAALRMFLTIGDAYSLAGDFEGARAMYESARRLANKVGDALSVAAIAHNRSTMALCHARFVEATGEILSTNYQKFLLELDSAENLESYLRLATVLEPYDVWKPLVNIIHGDFRSAESSLRALLHDGSRKISEPMRATLSVDLGYALSRLGNNITALEVIQEVMSYDLEEMLRAEERAILYSHVAQIYSGNGLNEQAFICRERALKAKEEFKAETSELRTVLSEIKSGLSERLVS